MTLLRGVTGHGGSEPPESMNGLYLNGLLGFEAYYRIYVMF